MVTLTEIVLRPPSICERINCRGAIAGLSSGWALGRRAARDEVISCLREFDDSNKNVAAPVDGEREEQRLAAGPLPAGPRKRRRHVICRDSWPALRLRFGGAELEGQSAGNSNFLRGDETEVWQTAQKERLGQHYCDRGRISSTQFSGDDVDYEETVGMQDVLEGAAVLSLTHCPATHAATTNTITPNLPGRRKSKLRLLIYCIPRLCVHSILHTLIPTQLLPSAPSPQQQPPAISSSDLA